MNEEIDDWHVTFEGVNFDDKPIGLTVVHHLDSGGLSIIIDGAEEKTCYLNSGEWLTLANFLVSNAKVRGWIDQQREKAKDAEILRRLELFAQMGLQGRALLEATALPDEGG